MTISTWKFRRSRATSQEEELRGKLLLEAEERARRRLRETGKTELFGGLNVGNHGNMWNIISWKVMKRNLWNVDQAPKCCDISILYLHEGIEDACPYLQHPATMNPNWAWHVYLLVVPPPPCYAATPCVQEWAPTVGAKGQRSPGDEGYGWLGSSLLQVTHGHPKIVSKQRRGWLICKFYIHDYDMHDTLPERLNFSHSNCKSLIVEFESYGTLIPKFGDVWSLYN